MKQHCSNQGNRKEEAMTMKTLIMPIVAGAALAFARRRRFRRHARRREGQGLRPVRRQHRPAGFASPDDAGNWTGFDVDYCRRSPRRSSATRPRVKFTPLSAKDRFTALQSGEIDVLARNTTWTMTRDTSLGLTFAGVNYYDGQGFMVRKSLGVDLGARSSAAPRSACRPAPPPSSTSPTTSRPTT